MLSFFPLLLVSSFLLSFPFFVQDFAHDGQAPDVFFWADGEIVPYITRYMVQAINELSLVYGTDTWYSNKYRKTHFRENSEKIRGPPTTLKRRVR